MKKKVKRQLRTVFLALFAAITFAWSAIFIFDVPSSTMLKLLLLSSMLIVLMMLAALVPALLLYYLKHGRKTKQKNVNSLEESE